MVRIGQDAVLVTARGVGELAQTPVSVVELLRDDLEVMQKSARPIGLLVGCHPVTRELGLRSHWVGVPTRDPVTRELGLLSQNDYGVRFVINIIT